ncbi:hypothetical protein XELAEV_18021976mg [Xenopus laevis]|uniref:Uncharacterized protein n=1 Tax=Xenopus laevis TaxID=8355 RepID=A0A974HN74_XENLA|nr:hypothetical protein XELAEV_18021976mg [Xenopus laevis]
MDPGCLFIFLTKFKNTAWSGVFMVLIFLLASTTLFIGNPSSLLFPGMWWPSLLPVNTLFAQEGLSR